MMTVAETVRHIARDDQGVAWIQGANMKVIELVREHLAYGWSADQLHEQHPTLSLGQIHSALAFFYDHPRELEAQMQAADQEYSRLRSATGESAFQFRLQALTRKG